jgi:hypothetical protein
MYRQRDTARDARILNEVIADCFGDDEERAGWYYYMAYGLQFPIEAMVRFPAEAGQTETRPAQIIGIDPKSAEGHIFRLSVVEPGSRKVQHFSPMALASVKASAQSLQALNDWLYWYNYEMLESKQGQRPSA